jgi:hypothetical protein
MSTLQETRDDESSNIIEENQNRYLVVHKRKIEITPKVKKYLLILAGCLIMIILVSLSSGDNLSGDNSLYQQPWTTLYSCPDVTTLKGKHKEATVFTYCSRGNPDPDNYYDMMRTDIHKIMHQEKVPRDIIVFVCPYVPFARVETLKRIGVIVVPAESLEIPQLVFREPSRDSPLRLHAWKLIGWERILLMDSDIYLTDKWQDIWDEPEAQIVKYPKNPAFPADASYLGVKVGDLYPFAFAATVDDVALEYWTFYDKFNSGVAVFTPHLLHYQLLINAAYDASHDFQELEQSVINFVYHSKGALPWGRLDVVYNYWPLYNPYDPNAKFYHCKLWEGNIQGIEELTNKWNKTFMDMKAETLIIKDTIDEFPTMLSPRVSVTSSKTTISILMNIQSPDPNLIYYALATNDLWDRPTHEKLEEAVASNPNFTHKKGSNFFEFRNLQKNTKYNIHYYAAVNSIKTPIYHIQYKTQKGFF